MTNVVFPIQTLRANFTHLKKNNKKKDKNFKNIQSLINKNIKLDKIKVNPFEVIEETKNKLGNFYHNQREADMLDFKTIERNGIEVPIIKPIIDDNGIKVSPNQKLENGLYPEHLVYLKSVGLCGQADVVEVVDGVININDYKTNKEIKEKGFTKIVSLAPEVL